MASLVALKGQSWMATASSGIEFDRILALALLENELACLVAALPGA